MSYIYKRGRNWRLELCSNGRRRDVNLGPDYQKAKVLKASIEQSVCNERFKSQLMGTLQSLGLTAPAVVAPTIEPVESVTVKSSSDWEESKKKVLEHMEKLNRKKRTIVLAEKALVSIEKILKPADPSDITAESVDHWIAALLSMPNKKDKTGQKKVSPAYALVYIRSAKACFRWFLRWKLIQSNPFSGCEMPKAERKLPNPISDGDLQKLLRACNTPLQRSIKILVYSGMRPDEFLHLTWKKVNLGENPAINISCEKGWNPKAHMERIIPCTAELFEALGEPGLSDELVAGKNDREKVVSMNWLERSFRRALKRSGLKEKGYTLYSCRDTYATNLALQGYEAHAIAARLGHTNLQTSMHYVSLAKVVSDSKGGFRKKK